MTAPRRRSGDHEGAEQQQTLWEALNRSLPRLPHVTAQTVSLALAKTKLDVQRLGDGFLLLNYPFFMNSFVDRFLVEVLQLA